jgi:hypothetical protein
MYIVSVAIVQVVSWKLGGGGSEGWRLDWLWNYSYEWVHCPSTSWSSTGMILTGKPKNLVKNLSQCHKSHIDWCSEKQVINCLSELETHLVTKLFNILWKPKCLYHSWNHTTGPSSDMLRVHTLFLHDAFTYHLCWGLASSPLLPVEINFLFIFYLPCAYSCMRIPLATILLARSQCHP